MISKRFRYLTGLNTASNSLYVMKNLTLLFLFSLLSISISAQEICDNLIDDDGDGLIDLLDEDCACGLLPEFNLIPNGGFENLLNCKTSLNDTVYTLEEWFILVGTPGITSLNCSNNNKINLIEDKYGITVESNLLQIESVINGFSQTLGTCLNEKLIAGESYIFNTNIIYDITWGIDTSGYFKVYGIPSCEDLENYTYNELICNSGIAIETLVSIPAKEILSPGWHEISQEFIPEKDYEAIAIAAACDEEYTDGYTNFFLLDFLNINVNLSPWEYEDSIVVNGNVCDFVFFLEVQESDTLTYQWYYNGNPINGETSHQLQLNGQNPVVDGLYEVTIQGPSGCSISDDFLLQVPINYESDSFYICPGDSIFVGIKYWSEPGSYTIKYLDTIDPCQIQLEFFIEQYESYEFVTRDTICGGDSLIFQGNTYSKTGTFTNYNKTVNGCDSLYILELLVRNNYNDTLNIQICEGQTYSFDGQAISDPGEYQYSGTSIYGCDSIKTLFLSIQNVIVGDTLFIDLDQGDTYNFNGMILSNPGVYTDTLTSNFGCDSIAILNLFFGNPCSFLVVDSTGIGCQDGEGYIYLDVPSFNEGVSFSIDGGLNYDTSGIFENLAPGDYNVIILNEGCVVNYGLINIPEYIEPQTTITGTQTINKGDTAIINLTFPGFNPVNITWESTEEIICNACVTIMTNPPVTTEYTAILTDENGCEIILETTIIVRVDSELYIPNIFTPNDDGINDYFSIFTKTENNKTIENLVIYDRWGNLIYEVKNESVKTFLGWDGKVNGRLVAQGVYAYFLKFEENDEIMNGTITVLR